MPSATAPLDTSTTCLSCRRNWAVCSAQRARASWSRPWPALVTRLLPTLTTRRRAEATTESIDRRLLAFVRPRRVGRGGVGLQVFHDRKAHRARSLSGERGDDKCF